MTVHSFTLPDRPGPFAIPTDNLIGDAWQSNGMGRIDVIDPSSGSVLTSVADAGVEEALAAVDAAEAAAKSWAATAPRKRAEILVACFHAIMAEQEWLAHLISRESGKALSDARGEVAYAAEFFRWYAEEAVRINGELNMSPSGANRIMVQYQPIGIALLITPWNFPAAMATRKIAPALAAGCTCILKPAEETPLTAQAVLEIIRQAGVPAGVVNLINTSDPGPVCRAILHDPRVRKLSFTGSTEVGRILLREAADQVIKTSMELGGNAPFLVFDDADLDEAIEGALLAKMRNGGEACTAANRFYVHRRLHNAFVAKLCERMGAIAVGPGADPATQCGAMINQASIDKIERLVADAVKRGAEVKLGGKTLAQPGYFYPPSVIANVQPGSEILSTEVFGPVAAVIPFEDEDQAIELANATEHGLAAYVYSRSLERALPIAERIDCGMVAINRGLVSDAAAPFGGVKQSGLGREGSHHGLLEYCEAKYIAVSW
ncbi:NAD-dependent succinate-semialdehyde dehydrogenase [Altererythrobacter sp. C41]|uniref:NAD-dependent succinate-semialdehyde dehydrogenase n=1 Tax=Altererythrobacter sp. C41 TaxID=2806021 RepID=UPI001EE3A34B|nr:NAD-dependent succinate-semialdehyde dehydrogenase [Altererythrobacter sp. C41]